MSENTQARLTGLVDVFGPQKVAKQLIGLGAERFEIDLVLHGLRQFASAVFQQYCLLGFSAGERIAQADFRQAEIVEGGGLNIDFL